jgi:hypothetical protein
VAGQLVRNYGAGYFQHVGGRLPGPGEAGIVQDRQMGGDACLQRFEDRLAFR